MRQLSHQALKLGIWYATSGKSAAVPEHVCPSAVLSTANNELATHKYVTLQNTLAGASVAVEGKATELALSRTIRKYRRDELALRILDWVDENPDRAKAIHELADEHAEDFTNNFTSEEFGSIGSQLLERGFLRGVKTWGDAIARSRLTSKGEQCLHSGFGPNDFENTGGSQVNNYEANISGNVGGLQQGDQNMMQVTQNNEVNRLLAEIRELVPKESGVANEHMEAIETQVKSGSRLTAPLRTLVTALASSLGTEAGQRVVALGEQLANNVQQG